MSVSTRKRRPALVSILSVSGATALLLAACSSSTTSSPTEASSPSSAASSPASPSATSPTPDGEAEVTGLIASVSGNTAQVTELSGSATVGFTDSTKVTESTGAALTDVTAGSCVAVHPSHEASGESITAASVRVSQPVGGKCPQSRRSAPGSTIPPSGSPTTTPARHSLIRGAVASVTGDTINVVSTDASGTTTQTTVTVDDKTKYSKQAPANTQAISAGKCMTAWGPKDGGGTLQATTIELVPHSAKCEGKPHRGG
jgi:hypothetical protein